MGLSEQKVPPKSRGLSSWSAYCPLKLPFWLSLKAILQWWSSWTKDVVLQSHTQTWHHHPKCHLMPCSGKRTFIIIYSMFFLPTILSFWCDFHQLSPWCRRMINWSIAIHEKNNGLRAVHLLSIVYQWTAAVERTGNAGRILPIHRVFNDAVCQGNQSTTWKLHEAAWKHGNKCALHVLTNSATANWNASIHMFYVWTVDAGVALGKACDTKSHWRTHWETASWASGMGLLICIYIYIYTLYPSRNISLNS